MNGKFSFNPPPLNQAPYKIDFLIIGGSIAGLACAFALRRVGHRVLVLEKDRNLDGDGINGCIRLPPNGSKIMYQWGLGEELKKIGTKSDGLTLLLYEDGVRLGKHVWCEELLRDAQGEFVYASYADFRRLLYRAAVSLGAKVRFNSEVASVDPEEPSVTLATGEVIRCDVLVGADGEYGIGRETFMGPAKHDPGDFLMYSTTVPKKLMMQDPDLAYFWQRIEGSLHMYVWFGNQRCMLIFPSGGTHSPEVMGVYVFGPPDGTMESWYDWTSKERMLASLGTAERRIAKMMRLATTPKCLPYKKYDQVEEWVHPSGRMVLIGEAAHPLPMGAVQPTAISLEDGGVLAKLFSHLRGRDQISSFLYAFEDLRGPRCTVVSASEIGNMNFMTMPPGPMTDGRNYFFQSKDARGLNVLEPSEEDGTLDRWEDMKFVFGYDAEDDADNWWVQWGLLAMRAKGADMKQTGPDNLAVQIDEKRVRPLRSAQSRTFGNRTK